MDLKQIQKLIKLMTDGEVHELEIEDEKSGTRLRLKRGGPPVPAPAAPMVHLMHGASMPMAHAAAPAAPAGAGASAAAAAPAPKAGTVIPSPMVGTFYRSPSPEAEAFARVGDRIVVDKTLCIIEAMKVMNEIKAEISGEVLEVLVENGEPVEFGQPLFLIKQD
jgi:acetyl-CoA carboxylase biotin carboxyl carrier protein